MYCLPEDFQYMYGRVHGKVIWPDGRQRRFFISEKTETGRPPWPVPELVEERELLNEAATESWLSPCAHPRDTDFGDVRRHFGYSAPGGKHLTRDDVISKYGQFVLKPAES